MTATTSIDTEPRQSSLAHITERSAAIIALVFAGVSMFYANTVSHGGTISGSDDTRMVLSAVAALGTVTMAIVSLAVARRNHEHILVADESTGETRIRMSAAGLVVVAAIVTIFQIALWTWT